MKSGATKRRIIVLTFLMNLSLFCNALSADDAATPPVYTISISSPQPEQTFQNSAQSITVGLSITPTLAPEDKVVMVVDGSDATDPQNATSIALPYLERGPHTLQAKIIQPNGQGAESDTITIYQQRTSVILNPAH